MKALISSATRKNWRRLKTNARSRLKSRANKSKSVLRTMPLGYLSDKSNFQSLRSLTDFCVEHSLRHEDVIYTLAIKRLKEVGLANQDHVKSALASFKGNYLKVLEDFELPNNEQDPLGLIYQTLLKEGSRITKGIYFTPKHLVLSLIDGIDTQQGKSFLDPCCGSGAFLMAVTTDFPENLYGFDNDPISVFIAKVNLLLKFSNKKFCPKIFCLDFYDLTGETLARLNCPDSFDVIATNPPWGAAINKIAMPKWLSCGDSFSVFFVKAFDLLKKQGQIRFLFPKSVSNVKSHRDFRKFLLEKTRIVSFTFHDGDFSGVATGFLDIHCAKDTVTDKVLIVDKKGSRYIPLKAFYLTSNLVFSAFTTEDLDILSKILSLGRLSLKDSIWALGIVTGNNKKKLLDKRQPQSEPVYTGKEITRYNLLPPKYHIKYNRNDLQQVAREEYYRAPEKLVYKFISGRPVFAYDQSGSLFLNSANILIPKLQGLGILTVLGLLNSELFAYLYRKLSGEIKILKGNLLELPFPRLSNQQDQDISQAVLKIVKDGEDQDVNLQRQIFSLYGLSDSEISYIRECITKD